MAALIKRIKSDGADGAISLDLIVLARLFACDTIGQLVFGQDFGAVRKGHSEITGWIDGVILKFAMRAMSSDFFLRQVLMRLPIAGLQRAFCVRRQAG